MAFDPLTLSPFAWWDASDGATITSSLGAVSQLSDKSGNARHLTQATSGKQPITGTRTINSLNALDFDGVDDLLATASVTQTQPVTIFAVVRADVTSGDHRFIGYGSGGEIVFFQSGGSWAYYAGSVITWAAAAVDTGPHTLEAIYQGASSVGLLDGVSKTTTSPGANGWTGNIAIGSDNAGTNPWDGLIAEVLIFPSALISTDRDNVRSYLNDKWFVAPVGPVSPGVLRRFPLGV